jgi:ribosomal-protein-alanine N-acetyltransferase
VLGLQEPKIDTENCILRIPGVEDALEMLEFNIINRQYLKPWEPNKDPKYFTEEHWINSINEIRNNFLQDKSCCFNLYLRHNNKLIGTVNYSNFIRGAFHSCFLGFKIAEYEQGKGLMSEAIRASIKYVFGTLNLHRISANYMPHNHASAKVLEKIGFIKEGIAENYLRINGKWETHILTSLVNPEWRNK